MIPVTKPFLPPRHEYQKILSEIWDREYLTNNGPLVQELEQKLQDYLGVKHLLFFGNGTVALQIAIKALGLKGEIITTPFSYIATTSSIVWECCNPIFVDIDPNSLNIDTGKIENAITPNTSAILATHVFGNPCDVEAIDVIAKKHSLKVIYDGAHCFGTKFKNESIFNWGDISITSFHATKIFHTVEGGALISRSLEVNQRAAFMRNFGHDGPGNFNGVGINGKNSELHAAMGICNLKYVDKILARRKQQTDCYNDMLADTKLGIQKFGDQTISNYAYYPVIFESSNELLRTKKALEKEEIFPRRYFYPSLNELDYVKRQETPISVQVAERILCLPLYHELTKTDQERISDIVIHSLHASNLQ